MTCHVVIVASHPVQYNAPWFRELARRTRLTVLFAHRQRREQQGHAGYGVEFDWDVDITGGFDSEFLDNVSARPGVDHFSGADTPGIGDRIDALQPDAVIALGWHLRTYWQAAAAARRRSIPVFVRGDSQLKTPRPLWLRTAKRIVYPWRLRAFDAFLPVGTRSRDYLLHYGVEASKCTICPHTIEVERFAVGCGKDAQDRAVERRELGVPQSGFVFAFAGRFVDWKRPVQLVEAVGDPALRDRAICLFIGAGPEEAELRRRAAELGVRAVFTGFRNQSTMPDVLSLADCLVLPSDGRETWGLVANEALAAGTPVLASDDAGCAPDLARLTPHFVTYTGGDLRAMKSSMLDRIGIPPDAATRAACSAAARNFAPRVAADAIMEAVAGR